MDNGVNERETESIGDKLACISDLFNLSEADLEFARHSTDITKTVRQVTKMVYPDVEERRKMKISSMDPLIVKAIIGKISSHP